MDKKHFYLAIYMSNFFLISIILSSIGGLIPFLASDLGIDERDYSTIFTLLSFSNILTAILYKALEKYHLLPKGHAICLFCVIGMGIFALAMSFMRTKETQCLMLAGFNFFCYGLIIQTNICLILAAPVEEVGRWLSYAHGFYGIGGLFGPVLVGIFRQDVFLLETVACLGLAAAYPFLQSP
jgi:MFS family permease